MNVDGVSVIDHPGRKRVRELLPPPEGETLELKPRTIYVEDALWDRLKEIAEQTEEEDPTGEGYSRAKVCREFLLFGAEIFREQRAARLAKRKK